MTRFFLILTTLLLCSTIFAQNHFYIKADANGNGDGSSWENAFNNFPDAFANYPAGAVFWVAEGVYHVTNSTNVMEKITLDEPVSIYGGFIGNESSLEERAWYNHPCFVSGNIGNPNSQTDNSRGFFDISNEDTLIDGLIFEDCYQSNTVDGSTHSPVRNFVGSKLTIVNCIFRYNTAWVCSAIWSRGLVNIENSLFHDNTNLSGGNVVELNLDGEAFIRNCTFANNQWETSFGIAIGGNNNAQAYIFNTIIKDISTNSFFNAPVIQANNSVIFGNAVTQSILDNSTNLSTEEPIFLNPSNADFRLNDNSPGVNWGNNNQVGEYYLDLAGAPRIRGGIVDAGCYETAVEPSNEGQVFYIDHDAPGNGDGSSWENAFKNFPDAFANYPAGAVFWVAEGVYHVTNGTNFMEKITLNEPVSIYGGFTGNESSLEERAWYNHPCFVSGNIGNPNSQTDNSRGFFDISNEETLIDGLIFQDIYQSSSADALSHSPIRSLPNSTLSILNCIFRYNTAWNCSAIRLSGLVNIENSLFHDNTNSSGGNVVTINLNGEAYIRNCTFANNQWETSFGIGIGGNNTAQAYIFNTIIKDISTNSFFNAPVIQANNSVIFGNTVSASLMNNSTNLSTEEPIFLDPSNADFRLNDNSPGVNWGNNSEVGDYTLDLGGAPRIRGGIVDAGCYETAVEPSDECVGDLDQNGNVDANDLLLLLTEFGCQSNCTHDLNNSGSVDTNDLLIFLSVFGQPC